MKRFICIGMIGLVVLSASAVFAIKTHEVDIGYGNAYDERVVIKRDATGRMLFKDDTVSTYVTLLQLGGGVSNHSLLSGLGADDHQQYFTSGRHNGAHSAAYNDALAISPDVHNNTTLGTHSADAAIHINRAGDEQISGGWKFSGTPEFKNNVKLSQGGAAGDATISFENGSTDTAIAWKSAEQRFELNEPLKGASAEFGVNTAVEARVVDSLDGSDGQGHPSAVLSGFESIEGILSSNLVDKSADEDVTGQWDFMSNVRLLKTITSLSSYLYGFTVGFTSYANSPEAHNGLNRWGAQIASYFQNQGTGAVGYSSNIGVEGRAESTGKTTSGESINDIGVAGIAASQSSNTNVVGVAGFADAMAANRGRIAVYGGMDSGVLIDPGALPEGDWAGYFAGNLGCSGIISGNGAGLSGVERAKGKTKTVAASGGDFTSIQSALDSISDASPTNPYTVIVYSGIYAERVTLKSYVNLVGASAPAMDSTNALVSGAIIRKNQSGSGEDGAVVHGNATCSIENLAVENTKNTYASHALYVTGGAVTVRNCILKSGHADTVVLTSGMHVIEGSWVVGGHDTISTYADVQIYDSTLVNNVSGSGNLWVFGSPTIRVEGCRLRNTGFGAYVVDAETDTATIWFVDNVIDSTVTGDIFSKGDHSPTIYAAGNVGNMPHRETFTRLNATPLKIDSTINSLPAIEAGCGIDAQSIYPQTGNTVVFKRSIVTEESQQPLSGAVVLIQNNTGTYGSGEDTADALQLKLSYNASGGNPPVGDFLQCDYGASTKAKIDKDGNIASAGYVDSASYVDGATGFKVDGVEVVDSNRFLKNIQKWLGNMSYNNTQFLITSDTADGSDSKYFGLSGGGAVGSARGGSIVLAGNEYATSGLKGRVAIYAGNVTSPTGDDGTITFDTSGAEAVRINRSKELIGQAGAAFGGGLAVGTTSVPGATVFRPAQGTMPPSSGLQHGDLFFETDGGEYGYGGYYVWNQGREQWELWFSMSAP